MNVTEQLQHAASSNGAILEQTKWMHECVHQYGPFFVSLCCTGPPPQRFRGNLEGSCIDGATSSPRLAGGSLQAKPFRGSCTRGKVFPVETFSLLCRWALLWQPQLHMRMMQTPEDSVWNAFFMPYYLIYQCFWLIPTNCSVFIKYTSFLIVQSHTCRTCFRRFAHLKKNDVSKEEFMCLVPYEGKVQV